PHPQRTAGPRRRRQLTPTNRTTQCLAIHHGMSRLGTRQPQTHTRRNERTAAPDGKHRTQRSMQSWSTYLDTLDCRRPRQVFPARPMIAPILCIAGPTAAGKSASIMALAERWPIEIITVDSATIYRGMDIGTAKPSAEERARIPHHLLDIRDPAESYSAAEFRTDALSLIAAIEARGNRPVLCGGTMLYYKALRE